MQSWQVWILLGIVLFILEIFTTGFVLCCFGIGCVIAGITVFFHNSLGLQIFIFSLTTALVFWQLRPIVQRYLSHPHKVPVAVKRLIGQEGIVVEAIDPALETGRIKVGGENWRAVSVHNHPFRVGSRVRIVDIQGTRALVVAAEN